MATFWLLAAWASAFSIWSLSTAPSRHAFALRCAATIALLSTLAAGAARGPMLALIGVVCLAALSRLLRVPLDAGRSPLAHPCIDGAMSKASAGVDDAVNAP